MCPAVSKSQQRLMGMVHAFEKGELKLSDLPSQALANKIKDIAKSMKNKDTTDFASTKHKGIPEEVPENEEVEENTLTDLPTDSEYGYTKDGVVQCIASRNTCLTRMKDDRQKNPGSKFQMIYAPELVVGEAFEGINEVKSDKDMVKDGLKYAKKKYKYNAKQMNVLAKEMLQYIKSGEIDDQAGMEAYVDFHNDEHMVGESFQGSIASDARGLSSGTLGSLTGKSKYKDIEKIQNDFVKFSMKNKSKYKDWHTAWKAYWGQSKLKEIIRGVVKEILENK